jgi:hypothetical protein
MRKEALFFAIAVPCVAIAWVLAATPHSGAG